MPTPSAPQPALPSSPQASPLPTLALTPIRPAVPASGGTLEVLVRVQAPPQPVADGASSAAARLPLRLALVVDRSGSMDGQPLQEAMRCADHIVTRLHSADQVAVVLYDHHVQVPVPLSALQSAGQRQAVRGALVGVESGGNTALFDGWQAGARQLQPVMGDAGVVARVLLLSDGQANAGLVDPAAISAHCAQWLAQGVGTSTVGLGRHFNEDLMTAMAQAGGGRAYYGQTAEDLFDSFDEELALLQALFLRGLRVKPVAGAGVLVEPLGRQQPAQEGWHVLADLPWGAETWLMLRLHLAPQAPSAGVPCALLALHLQAQAQDGGALQITAPLLALPVVSDEAFAALPRDEAVAQRLLELHYADVSARMHALVADGLLGEAKALLAVLAGEVASHAWLADKVAQLQAMLEADSALAAKEMRYGRTVFESRVVPVQAAEYRGDETDAQDVPAFLRRKVQQGRGRRG